MTDQREYQSKLLAISSDNSKELELFRKSSKETTRKVSKLKDQLFNLTNINDELLVRVENTEKYNTNQINEYDAFRAEIQDKITMCAAMIDKLNYDETIQSIRQQIDDVRQLIQDIEHPNFPPIDQKFYQYLIQARNSFSPAEITYYLKNIKNNKNITKNNKNISNNNTILFLMLLWILIFTLPFRLV